MQSRQFVLGHSFGLFLPKTPLDEPFVLSARVSGKNNPKQRCNYFDCDSRCESSAKTMQNAESRLDSAESQNLVKKSNQKFFYKVFASFCFCKKKSPLTPQDSNPPSRANLQNLPLFVILSTLSIVILIPLFVILSDSEETQKKLNKKSLLKFLLLFAFAKSRIPLTSQTLIHQAR